MFSYSVSRSYPFRWFTPVVFIGGIVAAGVFSTLSFVSNGYYLSVKVTQSPNATVSHGIWFKNWPSYLTENVQPTCHTVDIPVNSKIFTNRSGLNHELVRAWRQLPAKKIKTFPSLTYHENYIQDCKIKSIRVDLSSVDRTGAQIAWSKWGAYLRARTKCSITCESGLTMFELQTEFDYIPRTVTLDSSTFSTMVAFQRQRKADLWWGQSLLSMYYILLTRTMASSRTNETRKGNEDIRKGSLLFTPGKALRLSKKLNQTNPKPKNFIAPDITKSDFFDIHYTFITAQGNGNSSEITPNRNKFRTTLANLTTHETYPNIWSVADCLAKSFYSTVLTDLGQKSPYNINILHNNATLQHFTSNFSQMASGFKQPRPGPALHDYNTLKSTTGPLHTTPSVFSMEYVCQVPKMKSAGNIFISVLLADLVLLQTLWQLLVLFTDHVLLRKAKMGPQVNHCEGCLKRNSLKQRISLKSEGSASNSGSVVLEEEQTLEESQGGGNDGQV